MRVRSGAPSNGCFGRGVHPGVSRRARRICLPNESNLLRLREGDVQIQVRRRVRSYHPLLELQHHGTVEPKLR